jgi:hypothetical protein
MTRRREEYAIQRALCQHLQLYAAPDVLWFAVPNGGSRNVIEAANLKRTGVRAGVFDLQLIRDGRCHFLELKAPGGRATESQIAFQQDALAAGCCAAIATGIDQALAVLKSWGLLRGAAA